jgi:PAS domain S-box-containing protein
VVLLDLGLPDSQGMETLTLARKASDNLPIVVLTGLDDERFALEAVRAGAQDYLVKGRFDSQLLVRTIRYAIERKRAEEEVRRLNAELERRVAERTAQLRATNDALVKEIIERKRADEALRESEARFRSLYEKAAVGIQQITNDGRILMVNAALCRMLGYSESELLGRTVMELTHPDDLAREAALRDPVLRGEREWYEIEKRYIHCDGSPVWVHLTSSMVRDGSGHPLHRFCIVQNLTERKRAEEALLRSEKLASVGRMASTIAHEINNPLETIGHAVYLALTDPGTSLQAKSYLDLAVQELQRVTHITTQTLAFHRENITPKLIDLRESADSVLKFFAARLKSREITVEKRYAEVECIRAIGGEIRQVISNLLSNSMDAMPNHGKIQFRLSRSIGRNEARLVRFTIADTGSGIPPEQLKNIFEPFFTTKEVVGTGLGLWVTKEIVEKHGATIRVRSKPGKGTVFSIAFPIAEGTLQAR